MNIPNLIYAYLANFVIMSKFLIIPHKSSIHLHSAEL